MLIFVNLLPGWKAILLYKFTDFEGKIINSLDIKYIEMHVFLVGTSLLNYALIYYNLQQAIPIFAGSCCHMMGVPNHKDDLP